MILWHLSFQASLPPAAMGGWRPIVMNGWAGVDLFFALSGFLITWLILREEYASRTAGGEERFSLKAFYLRRALRILPAFAFVLLLNFFFFGPLHLSSVALADPAGPVRALDVFAYATFWGNYFRAYGQAVDPGQAFTVLWSLCVEEHFYLLWPPLLTLVRRRRTRLLLALSVCAGLGVLRAVVAGYSLDTPESVHFLSHYRMDSILWGATGAMAWTALAERPRLRAVALLGSGALLLGLLGTRPPAAASALHQSLGLSVLALTATLAVLEIACRPRSRVVSLLECAPLRAIGRVSYGMYLLHFQVMELAWPLVSWFSPSRSVGPYLLAFVALSAVTYAAAALMYRYVEKPFLSLKDARFGGPTIVRASEPLAPVPAAGAGAAPR